MKIRNDFVTNSSSSSYIVSFNKNIVPDSFIEEGIKKVRKYIDDLNMDTYEVGRIDETEFGWHWEIHKSFFSKINYLCIQIIMNSGSKDRDWGPEDLDGKVKKIKKLLEEILQEELGLKLNYEYATAAVQEWEMTIDHQSSFCENGVDPIFLEKESLKRFLFSPYMYIVQGNDNSTMPKSIANHAFAIYKKALKKQNIENVTYEDFLEDANVFREAEDENEDNDNMW